MRLEAEPFLFKGKHVESQSQVPADLAYNLKDKSR